MELCGIKTEITSNYNQNVLYVFTNYIFDKYIEIGYSNSYF